MKKLLLITMACASMAMASGWDNYWGGASNPITVGYYSTFYTNSLLPLTTGTGTIGASGNAFNAGWFDTLNAPIMTKSKVVDTLTVTGPISAGASTFSGGASFSVSQFYRNAAYIWQTIGNQTFYTGASPNINLVLTATSPLRGGWFGNSDSTKAWIFDSTRVRGKATGSTITSDTAKATMGLKVGAAGTMLLGIYTGNATGWTLENTVDTNVVSGATATSLSSVQMKAATATLTKPLCCRTVVDTLFISCAAADTAAVRAGSVDYLIFK